MKKGIVAKNLHFCFCLSKWHRSGQTHQLPEKMNVCSFVTFVFYFPPFVLSLIDKNRHSSKMMAAHPFCDPEKWVLTLLQFCGASNKWPPPPPKKRMIWSRRLQQWCVTVVNFNKPNKASSVLAYAGTRVFCAWVSLCFFLVGVSHRREEVQVSSVSVRSQVQG